MLRVAEGGVFSRLKSSHNSGRHLIHHRNGCRAEIEAKRPSDVHAGLLSNNAVENNFRRCDLPAPIGPV